MVLVIGLVGSTSLWAGQWAVSGPDGGDVRSLTYDPNNPDRIFLGTSTGVVFVSNNGGHDWSRFAHLGTGDDYVLDHIALSPHHSNIMYVSAWSIQSQQAGEMFRTRDGGKTWQTLPGMHGKSIRAMAMAASDSNILVTGALDGVFRSKDGGDSWERISPANHADIKNIESIAVDPKDPNVVYAGTWHLAWKTADGGANWQHINKGMIDDSDVFSIIVDHSNPSNVFASACSGIYKSVTAGDQFQKIQGIPFSARRTRVLHQDPSNPNIVYAGTTEGLWKTMDLGKTWKRVSNPEVVVNDVYIDPRNSQHVLLATDRSGVMASNDGASTWTASNHGYTHRFVTSIVADHKDPNTVYVGVVNDREWGGVFYSHDGGEHWLQKSAGLGGKDVFTLKQGSNGTLPNGQASIAKVGWDFCGGWGAPNFEGLFNSLVTTIVVTPYFPSIAPTTVVGTYITGDLQSVSASDGIYYQVGSSSITQFGEAAGAVPHLQYEPPGRNLAHFTFLEAQIARAGKRVGPTFEPGP